MPRSRARSTPSEGGGAFTVDQVRNIYARTAAYYDRVVQLFPLAGARVGRYRREAVAALNLQPGHTVVELGCGTGLNLALLQAAVGPEGRVIGVDLTPEMLGRARQKVLRHGWSNVELVLCDVAEFQFPETLNGVLSTLAITLSPVFDQVIQRAAGALPSAGRFVILDLKRPASWPEWLVRFAAWLNRPFAVTVDAGERHPWESIRTHLREVEFREHYFGVLYLSVGERVPRS